MVKPKILLLALEYPRWVDAGKYTYESNFGLEDAFVSAGAQCLTVPLMYCREGSPWQRWFDQVRQFLSGRRFDVLLFDVVHTPFPDSFLELIDSLAPVRVGFFGESSEFHPLEQVNNPAGLAQRQATVARAQPHATHLIAVDERDVERFNLGGKTPAFWWASGFIPERFMARSAPEPSQAPAAFHGTLYGDRAKWLEDPALRSLLVRGSSCETQSPLPAQFDEVNQAVEAALAVGEVFPEAVVEQLTHGIRRTRQILYPLWLRSLLEGCAVVNLPQFARAYASRVAQGLAVGRPVITWAIPNRPRTNALYEDGKEILLYSQDQPAQLADYIRRLQREPQLAHRVAAAGLDKVRRFHTSEKLGYDLLRWLETGEQPDFGDRVAVAVSIAEVKPAASDIRSPESLGGNDGGKSLCIGLKQYGHDTAVFAIFPEERDVFAISTERLTRYKHDTIFPMPAIKKLIEHKGIDAAQVTSLRVGCSFTCQKDEKLPASAFESTVALRRFLDARYTGEFEKAVAEFNGLPPARQQERLAASPHGAELIRSTSSNGEPLTLHEHYLRHLRDIFPNARVRIGYHDHEYCHAAAAYYSSGFDRALVIAIDGWGDENTSSRAYIVENGRFTELAKCQSSVRQLNLGANGTTTIHECSVGGIYSYFTQMLGFRPDCDEGKTEALAAYGKWDNEVYAELMEFVSVSLDHGIKIDHERATRTLNQARFTTWLARHKKEDLAAAVQKFAEECVVAYVRILSEHTGIKTICLSGGVAANVIINLRIWKEIAEELFVAPAMADDGSAQGAAILELLDSGVRSDQLGWLRNFVMPYWGTSYSPEEIRRRLAGMNLGARQDLRADDLGDKWPEEVADLLAQGKVGAIYQGRMEWGPRALGNRSILADARNPQARDLLNSVVKKRPHFQPFCPSILAEEKDRLFDRAYLNKHMTVAFDMRKEFWDQLPGAIHIDGTSRVQFVTEADNPNYHRLIRRFKELTGFGVVINTSFNKHGRTIVESPEDAVTDFLESGVDFVVIEGMLLQKQSVAAPASTSGPAAGQSASQADASLDPARQPLACLRAKGLWKDGQPLRLHLGCGERHFDGYVNVDYPQSEHNVMRVRAELFADITRLEFPPDSVDEIRSHHVFEHFSRVTALAMLIRWHRWLKPGGVLRAETPDLIGSARTLMSNVPWHVKAAVVRHLAGDQAASWGYHVDHWFGERFERTLSALGFGRVQVNSSSWSEEPFLSNVEVIAVKTIALPLEQQLSRADQVLWESTVSPAEKPTWEVWRQQLRSLLAGDAAPEASPSTGGSAAKRQGTASAPPLPMPTHSRRVRPLDRPDSIVRQIKEVRSHLAAPR